MNSKQRVVDTIAGTEPDQVPLGFYAVDYDTVEKVLGRETYVRNKIDIQLALWDGRRDEVVESLKEDTVEFYRRIDCADIILPKEAGLVPPKGHQPDPPEQIAEDRWEDSEGRVYQAVRHANEIRCVHDPTPQKTEFSVEDFEGPVEVEPPDPSRFEALNYVIEHLGEDRYVAGRSAGITALTLPGGTEVGLPLYALQPEVIHAANRRSVRRQNQLDKYYVHPDVPGVHTGQDTAGSNGPLISPRMFRELCFPYLKERVERIKRYTGQVIFHNCGNNIPLMDMFVEAGIDCYQSLQTTAGMEIGRLKEGWGDRMCFWGGVPVELLIDGTPQQVRESVRVAMERGAPGGRFILGPSHSVAKNTKYENFMAMLDEYDKCCG